MNTPPKSPSLKSLDSERASSPVIKRGASPIGTRRLSRALTLDGAESLDALLYLTPLPSPSLSSRDNVANSIQKKKKGLGSLLKKMKTGLDNSERRAESPESIPSRKLRRTKSSEDDDRMGAGRSESMSLSNPSTPTPLEPVPEVPPPPSPPSTPVGTSESPESTITKEEPSILQDVKDTVGSRNSIVNGEDPIVDYLQSPYQVRQILQTFPPKFDQSAEIGSTNSEVLQKSQEPQSIGITVKQGVQGTSADSSGSSLTSTSPTLTALTLSTWTHGNGDLEVQGEIEPTTSGPLVGSDRKTKNTPVLDDEDGSTNPTEKLVEPEQTLLQVLSPLDPTATVHQELNKMESTSAPVGDSPLINYGASAQRIRIKKPNLQKATLQRIFLQRRESESEADPDPTDTVTPIPNINGVPKESIIKLSSSAPEPTLEQNNLVLKIPSESSGITLPLTVEPKDLSPSSESSPNLGVADADADEDDIEIVREYLQPSQVSTVTVSVHPQPEDQLSYKKRLSIISEGEVEKENTGSLSYLNPEIEYSTIRRASDFTDSFRKLEPFKFEKPAVTDEGKRERLYKVLVVGELGTGKTSIIKRYVHQFFSQHYRATIGVDFALKVLRWDPETVVRLQLWDIAGQERFGSMTRVYYKEAVGAFVVFDVARAATLEAVPKWKADLDSKVVLPDGRSIPAVLLANKCDQPKEGVAANREKMNEFCQQQGFSAWFETSAKENINIDEAANFLVSKILEMDKWSQEPIASDPDKVGLRMGNGGKSSSNQCSC